MAEIHTWYAIRSVEQALGLPVDAAYKKYILTLTLPLPSQSASENISATFAGGISLSLKFSAIT